jgi:hypothetical protein
LEQRCAKTLSEVQYDRFDCIDAKLVVEDAPRGGLSSGTTSTPIEPERA